MAFVQTGQVNPALGTPIQVAPDPLKGGQPQFEGFWTPFTESYTGPTAVPGVRPSLVRDARNQAVPLDIWKRWVDAGRPHYPDKSGTQGVAPADLGGAGGTALSQIGDDAIKEAWNRYVTGQNTGEELKKLLGLDPTGPLPTEIVQKLQAGQVSSIPRPQTIVGRDVTGLDAPGTITTRDVSSIQAPTLGEAAKAEGTTIEATDVAGLQQIAAGQGPLADQVQAANALARMKAQQSANRLAAQATGYQARGLRRAAQLQGQEQAFEGQLRATETLADKATAATTKLADLDAQRKQAQADLDAARREGDANRIQEMTKKLADLDLEVKKANAEIEQGNANRDVDVQDKNIGNTIEVGKVNKDIETGNANRDVDVQDRNIDNTTDIDKANKDIEAGNVDRNLRTDEKNIDLGLKAQDQEEKQRIERGRFRIEAQKAIEDSAKGLLDEAGRQATLAMARRELAMAEQRFQFEKDQARKAQANEDRKFWAGVITNLATIFVPRPPTTPPKAAKGGLIAEPTLVAEGQHDELVIPVTGVTPALRRALSVESKPFEQPVPVGQLLKAALAGQAAPEPEMPMDWGKMVVVLAPGNNKARKVY